MKKLIVACAGMAALAAAELRPAAAADMPMMYSRPQTYVIFTWTGFYLGAHAGGGWGRKETTGGPFQLFVPGLALTPTIGSVDPTGWIAGGQIGANYQTGSFVFGIELDASASDLTGSSNCSVAALGVVVPGNCNAKIQGLGTVAGRLGVAFDRALIYGKGGAAWANDKYEINLPPLSFQANETRWGWMLGAGFEYSFTDNWSWKIEYNYIDFRNRAIEFTDTTDQFAIDTFVKERVHLVKAGINYRFGWAPVGVTY